MTSISDLTLARLSSAPNPQTSRSVLTVEPRFSVAAILRAFEAQRKELGIRLHGTSGAFTGFVRLETRPHAIEAIALDARIVVQTTIRELSPARATVELVAFDEGSDASGAFLKGAGVAVFPRPEGVSVEPRS